MPFYREDHPACPICGKLCSCRSEHGVNGLPRVEVEKALGAGVNDPRVEKLRAFLIREMQNAWDRKDMKRGDEIEGLLQPILPDEYQAALSGGGK